MYKYRYYLFKKIVTVTNNEITILYPALVVVLYLSDGFLYQQRGLLELPPSVWFMEIFIIETKETSMVVTGQLY
jgi:hypothetical protein